MYLPVRSALNLEGVGMGTNTSTGTAGPLSLPNPLTPMAFLPPDAAFELTITSYVMVASLAIMIWDILHTIGDDYILLTQHRIRLPTIIYFISKLATLGWLVNDVVSTTAPVGNCDTWLKATSWLTTVALPATAFLFFLRIEALYKGNKPVVGFFFLLWVGVCATGVISTRDISGAQIGPTKYCVMISFPRNAYLLGVAVLANDSLTLLAISWRLMEVSLGERKSFRERVRSIFFGYNRAPAFTRAFLKDGQHYYLSTAGFALLATITLSLDRVPLSYRGVVGIVDIMLLNVMACRVFRNTKLGVYRETPEAIASRVAKELAITVDNSRTGTFNSTGNDDPTAPTPLSGAQLLPFPRTPTTPASASTPYGAGNLSPNPFRQNSSTEESLRMVPLARYPVHRYREPNPWRTVWYE
ncbi:hypothetical protein D9613_010414 [Agrocybe pediades]|uniref:DUF6533 domain-containing protein n=1 Tax=Agrocybe pediades TaxID=84607 RepID=A0A8H4VJ66_9AGAR|nr:hypothetical protein D9613_010414 [Agrocybe pediades]